MSARILTGNSTLTDATRKAIIYRYVNVGQIGRTSLAIVSLDVGSDYTPHYAKKTKRSKFKRSGR